MNIEMLFNELDTFGQSNKRHKCSTSKSHDQKSYPRNSLMSTLPIKSDYRGERRKRGSGENMRGVGLGWGVENGDSGGSGGYMINRTKLTISKVIAIKNPTRTKAMPVASPLNSRDIIPKILSRIVLPATQREYPLTRSCEREGVSVGR